MKLDIKKIQEQAEMLGSSWSIEVNGEGEVVVRFGNSISTCISRVDIAEDYLVDATPTPSLRAEFAKAAMQGICASTDYPRRNVTDVAMDAVLAADALIAALKGEQWTTTWTPHWSLSEERDLEALWDSKWDDRYHAERDEGMR